MAIVEKVFKSSIKIMLTRMWAIRVGHEKYGNKLSRVYKLVCFKIFKCK